MPSYKRRRPALDSTSTIADKETNIANWPACPPLSPASASSANKTPPLKKRRIAKCVLITSNHTPARPISLLSTAQTNCSHIRDELHSSTIPRKLDRLRKQNITSGFSQDSRAHTPAWQRLGLQLKQTSAPARFSGQFRERKASGISFTEDDTPNATLLEGHWQRVSQDWRTENQSDTPNCVIGLPLVPVPPKSPTTKKRALFANPTIAREQPNHAKQETWKSQPVKEARVIDDNEDSEDDMVIIPTSFPRMPLPEVQIPITKCRHPTRTTSPQTCGLERIVSTEQPVPIFPAESHLGPGASEKDPGDPMVREGSLTELGAGSQPQFPRRSRRTSYIVRPSSDGSDMETVASDSAQPDFPVVSPQERELEPMDTPKNGSDDLDALQIDANISGGDEVIAQVYKAKPNKAALSSNRSKAGKGLNMDLPPMDNIESIFTDMALKALGLGLKEASEEFKGRSLRTATMCSGTESPLIAIQLLSHALKKLGHETIDVDHQFSAEVEPFKQSFIERNFAPKRLFRDVREFIAEDAQLAGATTAYGAKIPIPGSIDILVAGFVCKDLSRMNKHQKGLDEEGESGDTWNAIYQYSKVFRPGVVLIENVRKDNKFWDSFPPRWDKIGYECAWLICDTKNYYLPQTRERMYMIALERDRFGSNAEAAVNEWKSVMVKLQRQCSSPFDAFLTAECSDPQVYSGRTIEPNWDLCWLRYCNIRGDERLGQRRPISRYSQNGTLTPPDFANRLWYESQSSRVYDAIDIAHLQRAQAGYDSLYKMAVWDVSQNVDRFKGGSLGITPCITPNGCHFVTNRQTALNGSQLLILQGMPIAKLQFCRETQKERQDLAGNAMSTTVIGASIIAALISARKAFRPSKMSAEALERELSSQVDIVLPPKMEKRKLSAIDHRLSTEELHADARASWQLCACEGSRRICSSPVKTCIDCGHTACGQCSGNPSHNYGKATICRDYRIRPQDFESKYRPLLPARLNCSLSGFEKCTSQLGMQEMDFWHELKALADEVGSVYMSLRKFERQHGSWKITYGSSLGTLELHIEAHLQWRLFVNCPQHYACNSTLRKALEQPLAIGHIRDDVLKPHWNILIPQTRTHTLIIRTSAERISSWRNRIGLLAHRNETTPKDLTIDVKSDESQAPPSDIAGTYKLLQKCGTAMESLYCKFDGARNMYLFLQSDPVGPGDLDNFVFSKNHRRALWGGLQIAPAKVDASWRPWTAKPITEVQLTVCSIRPRASVAAVNLVPDTDPLHVQVSTRSSLASVLNNDCTKAIAVLEVNVATTVNTGEPGALVCALSKAKLQPPLREWQAFNAEHGNQACRCTPSKPRTVWNVSDEGKGTAIAYEDREGAAAFERAMKARPKIVVIRHSGGATQHARVEVGINVATLVHRAKSQLRNRETTLSWRIITDHSEPAHEPFRRFRLLNNNADAPFDGQLKLEIGLKGLQRRSLAWMRSRETNFAKRFLLTEVEEEVNVDLGWRVEARATAEIDIKGGILADLPSFGKTVTTIGLIESEFSEKTPSDIVAENKSRSSFPAQLVDLAATLIICPPHLTIQWREELDTFLGADRYAANEILLIEKPEHLQKLSIRDLTKARIVILSWKVLSQDVYVSQVARFAAMPEPATIKGRAFDAWLGRSLTEIPIRLGELKRCGNVLFKRQTTARTSARLQEKDFQASVPLKLGHGATYKSWSKSKAKTSSQRRVKQGSSAETSDTAVEKDRGSTEGSGSEYGSDWTEYMHPILQLFVFNRLVVDEYHYLYEKNLENSAAYASIRNLCAHKRWVLSGTPALSNFSDVNQIASLLGFTLGRDILGGGLLTPQLEKRMMQDQTAVEKFLSRTEVRSYQWHEGRHHLAQRFLDHFVRQNEPSLDHIACTEVLRPVDLTPGHKVVYTEVAQHVISQRMQMKKLNGRSDSDRIERTNASLNHCSTPEEALLKCAMAFESTDSRDAIHAHITKRQEQLAHTEREILNDCMDAERMQKNISVADEHYSALKRDVRMESWLGDADTARTLRGILNKAEKQAFDNPSQSKKATGDGLKRLTSNIRSLSQELTLRIRSLRFVNSILQLLPLLKGDMKAIQGFKCSSVACAGTCSDTDSLFMVPQCGHIACTACLAARINTEACVEEQCDVTVQKVNLLKASDFATTREDPKGHSHGKKMDDIAKLVKRIPPQDQGIVFVPNADAMNTVEAVFDSHEIKYHAVDGSRANAAKKLEDFKRNKDIKTQKKILILNLADESASGVNLVNTNHVIFIAPLLAESQHKYDSAMAQAMARCRRYRQEKVVHIYHFAALRTIDVDILEHRHKRFDATTESGEAIPFDHAVSLEKEKTKLVRQADGEMALVPISWLSSEDVLTKLGLHVEAMESFTSLIDFSGTFKSDEE